MTWQKNLGFHITPRLARSCIPTMDSEDPLLRIAQIIAVRVILFTRVLIKILR